jgi:DNA mismatch repair ATPase MutS
MVNYHFTDQYLEDKLYFDYRLKSGFTTATNAQQLMKMVGIPLVE